MHRLDAEMAGPLGAVIRRAIQLMRRKEVGFPLPPAEGLPADLVAAMEILAEEQSGIAEERDQRARETEAAQVEAKKTAARRVRRGG